MARFNTARGNVAEASHVSSCRTPSLLHQILSPKALIVGAVLATVWIYFLGFETVRLIEAALR